MKSKGTMFTYLLAFLLCSSSFPWAAEASSPPEHPPVVSTVWLAEHLEDPDLITLHIGPADSYEKGHIPGARKASLRRLIRVNEAGIRDEMLSDEDLSKALSELGISEKSRVVIYFSDEGAAWATARYLLTLEYVGMTGRVAYLDGGLPKWVAEKHPVSKDVPSFEGTDLDVTPVPGVLVDTKWLEDRFEDPKVAIVDGRPVEGYSGLAGHWTRLGHIPGASNIPFTTILAEETTYLLKSREQLMDMFSVAGAAPGDTVVVYCGTGLWASLPYLAARHLGFETRLYDGSFQEWSGIESLPVTTARSKSDSGK